MTAHLIIAELRALAPYIVPAAVVLITWPLAVAHTRRGFWTVVRYHLPQVARDEIDKLKREKAELTAERDRAEALAERLSVAVRGARAMLSLPRDEVREKLRRVR